MSYREKLSLSMTQAEVKKILGEPDMIEEGEIRTQWRWEKLIDDDGTELKGRIDFRGDVATSLSFGTPGAPEIEFIISI